MTSDFHLTTSDGRFSDFTFLELTGSLRRTSSLGTLSSLDLPDAIAPSFPRTLWTFFSAVRTGFSSKRQSILGYAPSTFIFSAYTYSLLVLASPWL